MQKQNLSRVSQWMPIRTVFFLFARYCLSYITLSRTWIAFRSHFLRPKRIVFGISPSSSVALFFLNSRRVSCSGWKWDFAGIQVILSKYISSKDFTFWNFVSGANTGAMTRFDFIRLFMNFGKSDLGIIFCIGHLFVFRLGLVIRFLGRDDKILSTNCADGHEFSIRLISCKVF